MTTFAGRAIWPQPFMDRRGNKRPGVVVTFYDRGTTDPATLYTDRTKATELPSNSTTTDAAGNLWVYLDPGDYDAWVDGETIPLSVLPDAAETGVGGVTSVDGQTGAVSLSGTYVAIAGFTELAQDAVGTALADTATLDLTYNDGAGTISGAVLDSPKLSGVAVTGTPTAGMVPTATSGVAATWQTPAGGDVTQEELDTGLALKLDIADAAPLSDSVPLAPSGIGSAGTSNEAMRADAFPPAVVFTLPVPLDIEPGAVDGPALIVRALPSQTGNIVEWRTSDDSIIAAIGAGAVDVNDGFGFPQYTGFPRLRGGPYLTHGMLKCTGAFWVEKEFFLVGGGLGTSGGQANYGNTGFTLGSDTLWLSTFGSGGSAKFFLHQGALIPQLRMGSFNVDFGTSVINLDTLSAAGIGTIVQGSPSQTADLSQWRSDDTAVGFAITAAQLPRWTKAANVQTTVGAAGAASALPATPSKYLKVVGDDGTTYVVPAYAAA